MAKYKEVESSLPDPWQPKNPGDTIEGHYLGSVQVKSQPRGGQAPANAFFASYRLRLSEEVTAVFGKEDAKPSKKKAGEVVGFSGAMLSSKFDQIPVGAQVRVTFNGKTKTANGAAKDYKVLVAEDVELVDPYSGFDPTTGELKQ